MRSLRRATPLILACAALILFSACGDPDGNGAGATTSVKLEAFDFYFKPTTISADIGGNLDITLTNNGDATHSFTAPDLDIEFEAQSGESASESFSVPDQPGSYDFYCKYHPDEMKGTVTIGGSDEPVDETDNGDEEDTDVDVDVDTEDDDAGSTDTTGY